MKVKESTILNLIIIAVVIMLGYIFLVYQGYKVVPVVHVNQEINEDGQKVDKDMDVEFINPWHPENDK